jgi:hypothetical protein
MTEITLPVENTASQQQLDGYSIPVKGALIAGTATAIGMYGLIYAWGQMAKDQQIAWVNQDIQKITTDSLNSFGRPLQQTAQTTAITFYKKPQQTYAAKLQEARQDLKEVTSQSVVDILGLYVPALCVIAGLKVAAAFIAIKAGIFSRKSDDSNTDNTSITPALTI